MSGGGCLQRARQKKVVGEAEKGRRGRSDEESRARKVRLGCCGFLLAGTGNEAAKQPNVISQLARWLRSAVMTSEGAIPASGCVRFARDALLRLRLRRR